MGDSSFDYGQYFEFNLSFEYGQPEHTYGESHRNENFNKKIYELVKDKKCPRILDIGCGGGGFISDCIDDGYEAVGIDLRSGYRFRKFGGWGKHPLNFFLLNAIRPFEIKQRDSIVEFDIITSWEVLEHFSEQDVDKVFENIDKHSKEGTYFFGTASETQETVHRCRKSKDWWLRKFSNIGFNNIQKEDYFGKDVIRDEPSSCFLTLRKA